MNLQVLAILFGILSGVVPMVAALLHGRSRAMTLFVVAVTLSVWTYLDALLRLVVAGPADTVSGWVYVLVGSATPILLSGLLLSASVGRENPRPVANSKKTFVVFGLLGILFLALLPRASFVTGYDWSDGRGTIHVGPLGKAYLSYLLVGIVWIGFNLESTFRFAPSDVRHRLKLPFLGFFAALGYLTLILTMGLLYSSLGFGKMIASGLPIALANIVVGYGFLRGALTDVAAPVSRHIVYTSFTALAAGLYVFVVGVVSQIATYARWSPDEVITVSFGFLVALFAVLMLLSNRFQRRVRRFIDQNFYVNRYDYRTQWSNVTRAFDGVVGRDNVLSSAHATLMDIFAADQVTISLRDEASMAIRPCMGQGADVDLATLDEDSPLYEQLTQGRQALLLEHRPHDFEYIPIYAENGFWLRATASQVVAPLFGGNDLIGCVGLARKQTDDSFTYEDVALLNSVAAHVAAALQHVQLADELAESREMQLMAQWSSMILHDLKNYLAPLRMVAQNLVTYQHRPNIAHVASTDINRVADRMESLVQTLSELRDNPQVARDPIDVNGLVQKTVDGLQLQAHAGVQLELDLQARAPVVGDESLLRRVLENLVSNAIESMTGEGRLAIHTGQTEDNGSSTVEVRVADTGVGISAEFMRNRLFRPFATTKRGGMGLGLYQCRSIVRAHGGQLRFESQPNKGTTVRMILSTHSLAATQQESQRPDAETSGVSA